MARPPVMERVRDSWLTTADPYHVPLYCGYVPQIKFQIGNTYGRTTHRLLTDPAVASSGKWVLADIDATPKKNVDKYSEPGSEKRNVSIENRLRSYGDRKYHTRMVPGYTGYIPRGQNHIAKRYGQFCVNSIADFIDMQDNHEADQKILKHQSIAAAAPQRGVYTADELKQYISKDRPRFPISPYRMENADPDKRFVSGYRGFCPRSRSLMGMDYEHVSHDAINTFTDDLKRRAALEGQPTQIHRPPETIKPSHIIYPSNRGMLHSAYTGYIPGQKFLYGQTFGNCTTTALEQHGLRSSTT